ncbi:hypothetical protein [Saccharothrix variisporea]|uniref:LSDAT prokaryote domain-containing protein n=1 Tax=Saccharothrix variisporea TaxID=543527 RepID=A0A495X0X7_9PSEU|nr:hypothetical protein [Saccharothrix variisporea]RKT66915.1 hypothetical protein DFJ66_0080 [Saccharothrix variisporea]
MDTDDRIARVDDVAELAAALDRLGVRRGRPVLALVGGAGGMSPAESERVRDLLRELLPALAARGAAVVDGGTDVGVMRVIGDLADGLPLVGVVAEGALGDTALEPHHVHVFVPGEAWGDESPWLAKAVSVLADGSPSVTLLVNGGDITYTDAAHSIEHGRPVVVLADTGRTADAIAAAAGGVSSDHRAVAIAGSGLTRVVTAEDFVAVVESALDPR